MVVLTKLSNKITLVILSGAVLILLSVASLAFLFTKSIVQRSIMNNQLELTRQTMDKIDRLLNVRLLNIQDIVGADPFEKVLIVDDKGGNDNKEDTLRRMNEYSNFTGPWDSLMIVDLKGKIVLSSEEIQIGKSVEENPESKKAFEMAMQKDVYYSDLVVSGNPPRPTIFFAAPIRNDWDSRRSIIGVVIGHFAWPAVLQILEDIPVRAMLFNHQGEMIGNNGNNNEDLLTFPVPKVFAQDLKEGHPESVVLEKEASGIGIPALASFAPQLGYLAYEGNGWGLILEQPVNAAFAPAVKSAAQLVICLVPFILIGALITIVLINKTVTEPLHILTQTVHQIAAGDLDKRVSIARNDEIGELAASFNLMTEKLKRFYEDLEDKIEQRTNVLREKEALYRTVLETAYDAFVEIDQDGKITNWNRQAEKMFGWLQQDALGKSLATLIIPPQYREAHTKGMQHFLATGEGPVLNQRIELSALHRDGHGFPVELTIWPTKINQTYRFNAFIHDISERKQLQEQLIQAQKMDAIERLAGGVAHDFNNILTVIGGYAQLLQTDLPKDTVVQVDFSEIQKAVDRAANLTKQLLIFSRRQMIAPKQLDLNDLTFNLGKMIGRLIGENIELIIIPGKNIRPVKVDPGQMEQVLVNLSVNARDAMPNGGKLVIETSNITLDADYPSKHLDTLVPGEYVLLTVSDTGAGIPSDVKDHIFEPFFTTKSEGKGTGLGLAMCYGFIKQSGGSIPVNLFFSWN